MIVLVATKVSQKAAKNRKKEIKICRKTQSDGNQFHFILKMNKLNRLNCGNMQV